MARSTKIAPAGGLRTALVGSAVALLLATTAEARMVPVVSCGQVVEGVGRLAGDLDCSGYAHGPAVIVKGTLELAGHTVTGNPALHARETDDWRMQSTVMCPDACDIVGPGRIEYGSDMVVHAERGVTLTDATIASMDAAVGVHVSDGMATIERSSISGSYGTGVIAARATIEGSTITGNGNDGVLASHVAISNSTIDGNGGDGLDALGPATIRTSTLRDNAGSGVAGHGTVDIEESVLTGNGSYAATGARLTASASELAANCLNPGSIECADARSCDAPALRGTSCATSLDCEPTPARWGVCSED